jgi:RNase P/RNase MRP subunit p29
MSSPDEKHKRALAVRPSSAAYEVGYGKPPAAGRFRPGQSGNPRGRPKGSRNRPKLPALNEERLKNIVLEEAYRTVSVNDAKGQVSIPMAQAVIRSLAVNAAKGHQRAQRLFTQLVSTTERQNKQLSDQWLESAITYKVEWDRELERRGKLGIRGPEPLPHPDHIIIDINKGTAHIRGPATKEEKKQLELWREYKTVFEEELVDLRAKLADPECPDSDGIAGEVAKTEKVLGIMTEVLRLGRVPETFPDLEQIAKEAQELY